ncbi:Heterogeneous nuclear ribonucleoprotein L [Hypsibius exemplaris]|uniref:Heterogeneous nuclear ribonucleoprotein L n=1 Tax=Hypsibius exemplaris TaxID=2072580 RepID=A0A1W0X2X4_HYPEX|nr:Heterogeneous nuclear ribonucleoprotein L [Hypsibius exemplaris]
MESPAAKRPRFEGTLPQYGAAPQMYGNNNNFNSNRGPAPPGSHRMPFNDTTPSPVVHIRTLPEMAVEADVAEAAGKFGVVKAVVMLPKKRQALVEMTDQEAATRVVQGGVLTIRGVDSAVNYSTSQKIHRTGGNVDDPLKEHNVLLLSVNNAIYPIDVDVIHKICSPHGNVQRIVVFRKLGIQAMVEFDTVQSAVTAKSFLNGADIYSGCCTLKIEFAKPLTLTILRNDKESWDYTRTDLPGPDPNARPQPLLQRPDQPVPGYGGSYATGPGQGFVDQPGPYDRQYPDSRSNSAAGGVAGYGPNSYGNQQGGYDQRNNQYGSYGSRQDSSQYGGPQSGGHYDRGYNDRGYGGQQGNQDGTVAMLYGLSPEKFNCDRLFNLFCLYGNVQRIKFLKTKEGTAMIQMSDAGAMQRAIEQLNGIFIFEKKLQVAVSRQANLNEVPNPYPLGDGTPSYKDFTGSRNNRFSTNELASKNRITPPTRCLHFFNAPSGSDEEEVAEVFTRNGSVKPSITILQGKSERSCSGFAEWETMELAVEALILANHTEMPNKKIGHPYLFKVCFTQPGRPAHGGSGGGRGPGPMNQQ